MVEAETNLSSLREATSLVARRLGYAEEYARVWIVREAAGDRIKAQGRTIEGWDVSILPAAWRGAIDWNAGTLKFLEEVVNNVELCLDGLVTAALLPAPRDNAAGREGWWAPQLYAWMIGGELSGLTPEMGPKILPAERELTRKIRAGLMTPWDRSKPDEPKQVGRTAIVNVWGELINSPAPKNGCIIFCADQGRRVFPRLDWLREEAERYAAEVRAGLTKLNDLIALDEANRTDWTRFVELVALIGGNLENFTPEEAAAVRLVNGFDYSSVQGNAKLRPALQEAKKSRRRIGDRLVEAVRADQLEIKGRKVSDLTVVVTIPASLVTADLIWSLLRSSELVIGDQHYVDVQIGPPESPEEEPEAPGPKPGGSPKQQAMCEGAKNILNNDRRRPKPQGRNAAIARMLIKQREFKDYKPATIEDYIRLEVREWEKRNPGK
jgi:hypothetical protein